MEATAPLALEDLLLFPPGDAWRAGAADPDLAPDGSCVCYAHGGALWLVDTGGGRPRRLTEGAAPRWSPAGNVLAFLRGEPAQLWIRDSEGQERQLTQLAAGLSRTTFQPYGTLSYAWALDGTRLAVLSPIEAHAEAEGETIVEVHRPRPSPGHALWLIDAAAGDVRVAARSGPGITWLGPAWSPDGRRVAVWENAFEATGGRQQNRLAVIDLESGARAYPAGQGKRQVFTPAWCPSGASIALPYSPHDFIHPFRPVAAVVPAVGGEVRCLATGYLLPGLHPMAWHPDGRSLYCRGSRGITVQVLRIDLESGEVRQLTDDLGVYDHLRVSADGRWIVCAYRTPTTLSEVYLVSTDGSERRQLTRASDSLDRFRLAETETVRWRAPGGPEIEGLVVKPLDYQPGRAYPAIVDLHGGPVAVSQAAAEFRPEWHWLAAQGYLVFAPEFRGSQLFGWDGPPDYNEHNFADVMAGVDRIVELGLADPERLAVRGHSGGAWLTTWILGHTDRFRAAIPASGGAYHQELAYASPFCTLQEDERGGKPWEVPDAYRRDSPLAFVAGSRTPTLILQGERDNLAQAMLLYTWLRESGAEVEFVQYRAEGHVLVRPEHRADCWRRTLAWFDQHLRGALG